MIRVGFVQRYLGDGWWGALTYFQNLFSALAAVDDRRVVPVLFLSNLTPDRILEQFSGYEVITTDLLNADRIAQAAANGENGLRRHERAIEMLLTSSGIALTSHTEQFASRTTIPNIYWIPDFQHERLPELFSAEQAGDRRRLFARQSLLADRILVSSYDARKDLDRYLPMSGRRVSVLRFVSGLGARVDIEPEETLLARYELPPRYFLLPNQYWVHKNHLLVVRALGILAHRGVGATVVSTGAPKDYRHPNNFSNILDAVQKEGVGASYRALGMVPYADLASLMFHSLAVINPSRFEGWSTTVEEAKAMGKMIALSRITVHLEQNPARARFFDPDSAQDLADCLADLSAAFDSEGERIEIAAARERNGVAFKRFGEIYQSIVMDTLAGAAARDQF